MQKGRKWSAATLGERTICFVKTQTAVHYVLLFICQRFQTTGHSNSVTLCVIFSSSGSFLLLTDPGAFLACVQRHSSCWTFFFFFWKAWLCFLRHNRHTDEEKGNEVFLAKTNRVLSIKWWWSNKRRRCCRECCLWNRVNSNSTCLLLGSRSWLIPLLDRFDLFSPAEVYLRSLRAKSRGFPYFFQA